MSSEVITKNDLTNILNEILPSAGMDRIVEQGTSGIWTYRKWNSGIAECWGRLEKASSSFTAWGSLYYNDFATATNYPFEFVDVPICQIASENSQIYVLGHFDHSTTALGTIRTGHNGTSSVVVQVAVYSIGRWK